MPLIDHGEDLVLRYFILQALRIDAGQPCGKSRKKGKSTGERHREGSKERADSAQRSRDPYLVLFPQNIGEGRSKKIDQRSENESRKNGVVLPYEAHCHAAERRCQNLPEPHGAKQPDRIVHIPPDPADGGGAQPAGFLFIRLKVCLQKLADS